MKLLYAPITGPQQRDKIMAEKYDLDKDPDYIAYVERDNQIGDLEFQALGYRDEAKYSQIKGDKTRYNECINIAKGYERQAQELREA